ncbi:hypothetical protein [Cryptosporangium arvum]|uniref:hypothetical protein n=1 Tax=Cryptosporangium arvum TaxID=80871 RepID=UPI000567D4C3|nr:hypothetical protein [Cryptosporangium arvum]
MGARGTPGYEGPAGAAATVGRWAGDRQASQPRHSTYAIAVTTIPSMIAVWVANGSPRTISAWRVTSPF